MGYGHGVICIYNHRYRYIKYSTHEQIDKQYDVDVSENGGLSPKIAIGIRKSMIKQ
jgi:hypothetical protein